VADFDITGQLSGLVSRLFGVFSQALLVFQYVLNLVSGLLDVLMILLLALYITTDGPRIGRYLRAFLPPDRHEQASRITNRIFVRLGGWVSGQILLCLIIGSMSWLGLTVIGVPYAVVLALIAGIMEAVPNIGPIIAAVPAVLIAALYSPWQALLVAILYIVIQQLENYVVVPRVMSRAVELHPLAVLLALLVGSELMGVLGAVLAVPVTAAISVIVDEIRSERLAPSVDTSDPALETTAPALETTDPTFDTPAPALDAATPALDEPLPREPISDQRRPSAPVDGQPPSPATQRPPADNP
jgi:predicted PurR-regulated permease PerM